MNELEWKEILPNHEYRVGQLVRLNKPYGKRNIVVIGDFGEGVAGGGDIYGPGCGCCCDELEEYSPTHYATPFTEEDLSVS